MADGAQDTNQLINDESFKIRTITLFALWWPCAVYRMFNSNYYDLFLCCHFLVVLVWCVCGGNHVHSSTVIQPIYLCFQLSGGSAVWLRKGGAVKGVESSLCNVSTVVKSIYGFSNMTGEGWRGGGGSRVYVINSCKIQLWFQLSGGSAEGWREGFHVDNCLLVDLVSMIAYTVCTVV